MGEEVADGRRDLISVRLQREVARVEKANRRTGMSRLNASAPAGRKNGSFLPHTARNGGLMVPEIGLKGGIKRDIALVVTEEIELHLIGARPCQIEVVERVSIRRNQSRVWDAVRILPDRGFRGEEGTKRWRLASVRSIQ